MSPENFSVHLRKGGYDGVKSDIFSLGMILFSMCFKSQLWNRPEERQNISYRRLRDKGVAFMLSKHAASMPYDLSDTLIDLFTGLLAIDPSKRFDSVDQILAHPYLLDKESDDDSVMTELNQEMESCIKPECD